MIEIPLTKGKVARIDDQDVDMISQFKWSALAKPCGIFYARSGIRIQGKSGCVYMHRLILGLKKRDGVIVDHKDGDGLNNSRENLRTCTTSQNAQNRKNNNRKSGYKGVFLNLRASRPWYALIKIDGRVIRLGCFLTKTDAAVAYDRAAQVLFGEFARLNFPAEEVMSRS